jgi:RimJ/RimL family protein N-acetyltransferase
LRWHGRRCYNASAVGLSLLPRSGYRRARGAAARRRSVTSMPALAADTIERVDGFWMADLGCPREWLRSPHPVVLSHADDRYAGIFILLIGEAPVISLPHHLYPVLHATAEHWSAADVLDVTSLRTRLGNRVDRIIGPAFIGYADHTTFRAVEPNVASLLDVRDHQSIDTLRTACDALEWEHGGSGLGPNPAAGMYVGRELVALAGYQVWGGDLAHIAIITHPQHRGHGYAGAAVSKLTETVLARGLVPQYQTLDSNRPSIQVAQRLGFVRYGTSMAVRLPRRGP